MQNPKQYCQMEREEGVGGWRCKTCNEIQLCIHMCPSEALPGKNEIPCIQWFSSAVYFTTLYIQLSNSTLDNDNNCICLLANGCPQLPFKGHQTFKRRLEAGKKGEGRNAEEVGLGGLWICRLSIRWIMSTNKMFNPAPTANMTAVKYNIFHQTPHQVPNNNADNWWIRHSRWVMGTPQWSQRWVKLS